MAGTKVQVVLDERMLAQIDEYVSETEVGPQARAWKVRWVVRRWLNEEWDRRALEAIARSTPRE